MLNKTFNIVVEQGTDGFLISSVIELPGCHTQAMTYDELLTRTKEAIELYLDNHYRLLKTSFSYC
jgi:predicted RNase H-like HicB family nuclease